MSQRWNQPKPKYNYWPGRSPQWPQQGKGKKGKTEKGAADNQGGKQKDGLPLSYASTQLQTSSSSAGEDQGAQAFMSAFLKVMQDGHTPVPEALKPFLPDQEREELKQQQKLLNKVRSIKQKIAAKEKAITKDDNQWTQWLEEVKSVIETQKKQHEENQEKLQSELKELLAEQEKLRNMKDMEMDPQDDGPEVEPIKVEDYVEHLLAKQSTVAAEADKKVMVTEEEAQRVLQQRVQEMQNQLQSDFQQRLQQAQLDMEQRLAAQVQQEKITMQQALLQAHNNNAVIQIDDDKLDPKGVPKQPEQGYGAERVRSRTEASPYRPTMQTQPTSPNP